MLFKSAVNIFFVGALVLLTATASAQTTRYLHLAGTISEISQDEIVTEVNSRFLEPMDKPGSHIKKYYFFMVDGNRSYFLNIIIESLDAEGAAFVDAFDRQQSAKEFHSQKVVFRNVRQIVEQVHLVAGLHQPGSSEDSFTPSSALDREFRLSTLTQWEAFTDKMGFAFQSKKSADFLTYLAWFFRTPDAYQDYARTVLARNNVVLAELTPVVILDDGSETGRNDLTSPFFDLPFVRTCWATSYENGMCFGPTL